MRKSLKALQGKSSGELQKELKATNEALYKMRFQKVVEEKSDTSQFKKLRVKIAQIKTLLRSLELQEAQKASQVPQKA